MALRKSAGPVITATKGLENMQAGQTLEAEAQRSMPRFIAIDGLRAWMAWVVVVGHITQQSLFGFKFPWWGKLDVGGEAVNTFIIISGFVITHLIIERGGNYAAYIIPRFMRLFPAFFVGCAIGGIAYAIAHTWADPVWFQAAHAAGYKALSDALPAHTLAHLFMLHGMIPNSLLPQSEYAFIPPGWSVSLEWQFYLIAPIVIWLCRSRNRSLGLVAIVVLFSLFYHHDLKPLWDRPSLLVGTSKFFLIGIACRFAAPSLAGLVSHVAAIGIGLSFTALWMGSPSIAIWLIVYTFILKGAPSTAVADRFYVSALRFVFESKPILYLAERSYSTYLLHWPVIMLIGTVATRYGVVAMPKLTAVMFLAFPITLLLQEPLYRFVEVPGRTLGKALARKVGARDQIELPQETIAPHTA